MGSDETVPRIPKGGAVKRTIGLVLLLIIALGVAPMTGSADHGAGPQGCAAGPGETPDPETMGHAGGIVGVGTWSVAITRGEESILITDADGPFHDIGTILVGDIITCSAGLGAVAAGTPGE